MVNGSGAKFLRHEIFVTLILALYFIKLLEFMCKRHENVKIFFQIE